MTKRDKVESVGQAIFTAMDDLKHLQCPQCGLTNLAAEIHDNVVGILCKTPLRIDPEDSAWVYCDFSMVVSGVNIDAGPFKLVFAEERPVKPPVRTTKTRQSRTKQVRKAK